MSIYDNLLKNGNSELASDMYLKTQKNYKWAQNITLNLALVGGILAPFIIGHYYGDEVSQLCFIITIVWYLLGYQYCSALWNKEKDSNDYFKALSEHKVK